MLRALDAQLEVAARLEAHGIVVRSPELAARAELHRSFVVNGGNRAMRRAAARHTNRPRP
jgi:hypothetical protein